MIKECSVKIVDWLIGCNVIQESDKDLYEYAVYSIFLTASPVILAITAGLLLGAIGRSLLIILPFVAIRKYSGGYHAKTPRVCFVASSLLLVLCIILSFHIKCSGILMCITVGAIVSLGHFSPIDNENRVLSKEEHIYYKKKVVLFAALFFCVATLLYLLQLNIGTVSISIGIILSAALQFPAVIEQNKKTIKSQ